MSRVFALNVVLSMVLTASFAHADAQTFTFKDLQQKLTIGKEAEAKALEIGKQIEKLTAVRNELLYAEGQSKRFDAEQTVGLLNTAAKALPAECSFSTKVVDGIIETALTNSKTGKSVKSSTEQVTLDTAMYNATQLKLWSYNGELIFFLNKSNGALEKILVTGNNGWLSCPEEKPVDCSSCE